MPQRGRSAHKVRFSPPRLSPFTLPKDRRKSHLPTPPGRGPSLFEDTRFGEELSELGDRRVALVEERKSQAGATSAQ